jgi:hypothetical protein
MNTSSKECKECQKGPLNVNSNYKIIIFSSFISIMAIYGIVRIISDIIGYLK